MSEIGNAEANLSKSILENNIRTEVKAEPRLDLVAKYQLFDEEVHPKKDVVYHPCGGNDVSPSVAFPDSKVIYVELDKKSVKALKKEGFNAHYASALKYNPGNIDILIMLNPQIPPTIPANYVLNGGYVLCNDYHETATIMKGNPDFQLRGLIRSTPDRGLIYDTDQPENYWKDIDTEEEFINAPFDWGAMNYVMALPLVEAVTGKKENVLAEYKKILEMAKEQQRQENAELILKNPELAKLLKDPDEETIFLYKHNGEQFPIVTQLPRKKGTVDDFFVFQRIHKSGK